MLADLQQAARWEAVSNLGKVSEYRAKGHTYFRIRIKVAGVVRDIYRHMGMSFSNRAHAEQVLEHIRFKLSQAVDPLAAIAEFLPRKSKPNLVLPLILQYAEDQKLRAELGEISDNTVRGLYRWIPRQGGRVKPHQKPAHLEWWRGKSIHEVKPHHVDDFRRHMQKEGLGTESIRSVLESLRSFFAWCRDRELIETIPKVKLPVRIRKRRALLTANQQRRVLEAIPWDRRGIFLLMALGVRPGSARAVLVEDVQGGFILVRRAVQGHNTDSKVGPTKGKRESWVPLTKELARWIRDQAGARLPGARLFWNPGPQAKGQPWNHASLWLQWKAGCAAAGVPYVPLYAGTKHSFATGRLMAGKSKDAVGEFLGIGRQMVDTYAQWARELSAEVLDEEELSDETRGQIVDFTAARPQKEK